MKRKKRIRLALLAFCLSGTFILIIYVCGRLAPFGDKCLISIDAWTQYLPMLTKLRDGAAQWSFSGSLGFNQLTQGTYYTMSPLWLLLYLVPRGSIVTAVNLIVALRFALAGMTFYLWLNKRYPNAGYLGVLLSTAYAFSSYGLAFINQFMWMDAVVLLPLVAIGLERLCGEHKPLMYLFVLALTLYSCFYTGYMVCIFCVIYFLLICFREKKPWKTRLIDSGYFSVSSLLAGGVTAGVLLPMYMTLQNTIASGKVFGGQIRWCYSLFENLRSFLPLGKVSMEYGVPNMYCGFLCLLLCLAYPFLRGQGKRRRILFVLVGVFIALSVNLNVLIYIWHGFHFPNQLPGRESFIFIFLIVGAAYPALRRLSDKTLKLPVLSLLVGFAIAGELLCNSVYIVTRQTHKSDIAEITMLYPEMAEISETYADGLHRIEKANCYYLNFAQEYHCNGISYYSSTMSEKAYRFFERLGMDIYAENVNTKYVPSDILNMIFGVKYIVQCKDWGTGETEKTDLQSLGTAQTYEDVSISENKYCLPFAFCADSAVLTQDTGAYDGQALQNEMLRLLSGDEKGTDYTSVNALSAAYEKLSEGGMKVSAYSDTEITGTVSCKEDCVLFTSIANEGGWTIYVDGERAEMTELFGYLCGTKLTEGTHEIRMKYCTPGLIPGIAVSGISLLLVGIYVVFRCRKKRTNGKPEAAEGDAL